MKTVTHLSTNRGRRGATSSIDVSALPQLTTTRMGFGCLVIVYYRLVLYVK